ncbi:porin [Ampullimonas aquatilis]|uniref:porin n=1 Tax=Ampullimonas aquatilis TaxID=1341549 RepID=UPI003C760EEF
MTFKSDLYYTLSTIPLIVGLSSHASAQTSVTLYGIVDAGLQYTRLGNSSLTQVNSGIAEGSRFGFKGNEDLGNGYRAIFTLESRLETDTGQLSNRPPFNTPPNQLIGTTSYNIWTAGLPAALAPTVNGAIGSQFGINTSNTLFDRQAYVGLVTPVGGFLIGRQYTPAYEVLNYLDPMEAGNAGTAGNLLVPGAVELRWNNTLQYRITHNGVKFALSYSPGENAANSSAGKRWGSNVRYVANGWDVGLGYNHANAANGSSGLKTWAVGGSYTMDNLKLFVGYTRAKNDNSDAALGVYSAVSATSVATANAILPILLRNFAVDEQCALIGAHYRIGQGRIMASFGILKDKKTSIGSPLAPIAYDGDAKIYGIGYDYDLSKRTDIYTFYGLIKNNKDAAYAPGGAGYLGGYANKSGATTSAIQFGIRHRF